MSCEKYGHETFQPLAVTAIFDDDIEPIFQCNRCSRSYRLALHEWRGSSRRTMTLVAFGLFVLIASTIIVGYGNYLGGETGTH